MIKGNIGSEWLKSSFFGRVLYVTMITMSTRELKPIFKNSVAYLGV
jgi:hypothetical protein